MLNPDKKSLAFTQIKFITEFHPKMDGFAMQFILLFRFNIYSNSLLRSGEMVVGHLEFVFMACNNSVFLSPLFSVSVIFIAFHSINI